MSTGLKAGTSLELDAWNRLRLKAIFEHCKWDPQSQDQAVLGRYPIVLEGNTYAELQRLAESLSAEALDAEKELLSRPNLWRELGIPRRIRSVLRDGAKHPEAKHVRVMRFDFHMTDEGWRISEVNADVPGGYVEGGGWNSLFAEEFRSLRMPANPAQKLTDAIRDRVEGDGIVALVHATNYSDDRQVMMHLAKELRRQGMRALLAGPRNIEWKNGKAFFRSDSNLMEVAAAIRFFPAEWLPQLGLRGSWENWFAENRTVLCNPGSAILLQSKRFPLVWKKLNTALNTWQQLLPTTVEAREVMGGSKNEWVIKPAFGRVGEDVGMKGVSSEAEFRRLWRLAAWQPRGWIAQRRFRAVPLATAEGSVYPCFGVFTVNGKFAGIYGRAGRAPLINHEAQDVAVLVDGDSKRGVQ